MSLIKYPYTDLHSINLDWIIEEVKKCYSPENPPDMAVLSVNGMTGNVTLYTDPAAVFPAIDGNTWTLGRTAAGTLVGIKFNKNLPLQRMNGTSLFNIYDAGNPPPYPVTSVNGRTGNVQVQEAFFSLAGDTITFITDSPDHSWSLDRATVDGSISLRLDTTNNTPSAYLEYVSADDTISRTIKLLTPDDIPSSSGVVSVNGKAGVVTLSGDDIPKENNSAVTVASALNTLGDDVENITDKIGNTSMGTQATTITGAILEHSNKLLSEDHLVPRFVRATITIPSIAANAYAEAYADVEKPTDTTGVISIIPQYTSEGIPIAGAYVVGGAAAGYSRITVGVRNYTSTPLTNVTATVDVIFKY